jgi:hypothetical protein
MVTSTFPLGECPGRVLVWDTEVVQCPRLVLDLQRERLAGRASEERRGEMIVGLQVQFA